MATVLLSDAEKASKAEAEAAKAEAKAEKAAKAAGKERGIRSIEVIDAEGIAHKINVPTNADKIAGRLEVIATAKKAYARLWRFAATGDAEAIDEAKAEAAGIRKLILEEAAIASLQATNAHVAHADGDTFREAIFAVSQKINAEDRARYTTAIASLLGEGTEAEMLSQAAIAIEVSIGLFAAIKTPNHAEAAAYSLRATLNRAEAEAAIKIGGFALPKVSILRQVTNRTPKAEKAANEAIASIVTIATACGFTRSDDQAATMSIVEWASQVVKPAIAEAAEAATEADRATLTTAIEGIEAAIASYNVARKIEAADAQKAPTIDATEAATEAEGIEAAEAAEAKAEAEAKIAKADAEADRKPRNRNR